MYHKWVLLGLSFTFWHPWVNDQQFLTCQSRKRLARYRRTRLIRTPLMRRFRLIRRYPPEPLFTIYTPC